MSINQKIEAALSDLVDGNIWPVTCPQEQPPEEWITYISDRETPEEFGDGEDLEWVYHLQVHWFKKSNGTAAVNYLHIRKKIRSRLKDAGFTVSEIVPLYEQDTHVTHLVVYCSIIEDDPYSEEE